MRFTIVGPTYPLRGGIAHHVYGLHQELSARGHDVQIISFRKLYPRILFPGRTTVDESELKLEASAAPILDPLNPLSWFKAFRQIERFAPDAVIMQWWNPFFAPVMGALARLLKSGGIEPIFECHNVFPHERTFLDLPLIDFAFAPVELFITHSKEEREHLLKIASIKKVGVAPLPTIEEFRGDGDHDRAGRSILFFGIVRRYKGLDVLLRAMPKTLSQVKCELVIVGEFYDPLEKYIELIQSLGIERYVSIENRYVSNEEVPNLFNRADVLALPYLSATQSAVARIALASCLPIIASRTGGLSETVEENVNGLLFPPGDADALAENLIRYFTDGLGPVFYMNLMSAKVESASHDLCDVITEMASDI